MFKNVKESDVYWNFRCNTKKSVLRENRETFRVASGPWKPWKALILKSWPCGPWNLLFFPLKPRKPMQWSWQFCFLYFIFSLKEKELRLLSLNLCTLFKSYRKYKLLIMHVLGVILTFLQVSLFTLNNFIALRVTVLCFYKAVSNL